jgi:hypothetical protein
MSKHDSFQLELFAQQAFENIERRLPKSDWLSVAEVACAFDRSVTVVYAWIEQGSILNFRGSDSGANQIFRPSVIAFAKQRLGITDMKQTAQEE